ncbi:MAG: TrmJ/YjtD family RNA methyltransferase [Acidobacteria bacterium]|nr:TrmJ/YjtD family RNA methyltransferase [Acidobacteriota bacterium]
MNLERNARLKVVLIDTRNPLNIGAAARAMSNFGFFELRLVSPYDVAFREAVSAVGAADVVKSAAVYPDVASAVRDCSLVVGATGLGHRQMQHPLHRLEKAGRLIRRHLESANAALLFGSEKFGLSNSDVAHCHWLAHIPTRPDHDSMNLAQAVAVCLYELIRHPSAARRLPEPAEAATGEEVQRFTQLLEDLLQVSGYTDYDLAKNGSDKTHRLVRRLHLRARDASVWTGMLRQILWKIRNP